MSVRALFGATAWLLSAAGTGAGILAWLRPPDRTGPALRVALALFVGFGALAWLWLLLSLLGLPLDGRLLLVTSAPGLFWALWRGVQWRHRSSRREAPALGTSELLLLAVLALAAALVVGQCLAAPLRSWDARTHWTMLARVLYFERSVNATAFRDPLRLLIHRNYPLLLPLTEWSFFHWIGSDDDRLVRLVSAVFFGVLLLAQYGLVRRSARRSVALLASALLGTLPLLVADVEGGASSGCADVPLAAGVACYLACVVSWLEDRRPGDLTLAALVGTFLVLTKQEGLAIVAAATVLLVVARSRPLPALIHGSCVLLLAAPWLLHAHDLPRYIDLSARFRLEFFLSGLSRIGSITVYHAAEFLLRPDLWSLFWWLFLICVFTARRPSVVEQYCLGLLALMLVIHFLVDVLAPWGPDFLDLTTRSRMFVQVAPAAALFVAMRLEAGLSAASQGAQAPLETRETGVDGVC